MINVILGLPGRFTDFCRDVCVAILERSGRGAVPGDLVTLADLGLLGLRSGQSRLIAVIRRPERSLGDILRASERSFLLVIDDPRRAVLHRHVDGGLSPRDAIIEVSTACACMTDFLSDPGAIRITHEAIGQDTEGFAARLLAFLELPADDPGLLALATQCIAEHLHAIVVDPHEPDIAAKLEEVLGASWGLAAKAALGGYWMAFFEGKVGRLIAARDLFIVVEGGHATDLIDATGRPRCLAYGPYLRAPRGDWILRMTLAFSPELAGTPFTLDVTRSDGVTVEQIGKVSFEAISGRYVAQTAFTIEDPVQGLEFRLFVDKATFDGKVALGFAELERVEAEAPPNLEAATEWNEPA